MFLRDWMRPSFWSSMNEGGLLSQHECDPTVITPEGICQDETARSFLNVVENAVVDE